MPDFSAIDLDKLDFHPTWPDADVLDLDSVFDWAARNAYAMLLDQRKTLAGTASRIKTVRVHAFELGRRIDRQSNWVLNQKEVNAA
ncbi:hypothetical protein [Bradyrhizobium sp. USDA 4502]